MTTNANAGAGWKIAFIVLTTAVVAIGATYLVLEARRPGVVVQTPLPEPGASVEKTPLESLSSDSAPGSEETVPGGEPALPSLSGDDLLSGRYQDAMQDAMSGAPASDPGSEAQLTPPTPPTVVESAPPATSTGSVQPDPRLLEARNALASGQLQRSVLLLEQLETTDQWAETGEIKVLEENILAALETAEAGLSGIQRQRIQEALTLLGHDTRGVDGLFGSATRRAIREYQSARNQRPTSYLTEVQLGQLLGEAAGRQRQLAVQQQAQQAQQAQWDDQVLQLRSQTEQLLQAGDLQTGLIRVQEGLRLAPDNSELMALQENLQMRLAEVSLDLSQQQRQRVQRTLQQLGYNIREEDGSFGQTTRTAISAYQRTIGQPSTGYLSESALDRLLLDAGQAEQSAAITAQEELADLLNVTRDVLARSDPYRDESLLREQLSSVVGAQDSHPQDQNLLGLELALRARLEEVGLGLGDQDRRAIQQDLTLLGFDTRGADGHFGPGTREAVNAYQRSRGLPTTGYLSGPLLEQLWEDARSKQATVESKVEETATENASNTGDTQQFPISDPRALLEAMDRELRNMQQRTVAPKADVSSNSATVGQDSAKDQSQDQVRDGDAKRGN